MKKSLTKYIALIMALTMLLLTGCSNISIFASKENLINIDISSLGDICIESADSNEKYCVMSYFDYLESNSEDEDIPNLTRHITIFSTKTKLPIITSEYDYNDDYYKIKANNNDFIMTNQESGETIIYDYKLNELSRETGTANDNRELVEKIDGINIEDFNIYDTYAKADYYGKYYALIFYDKPEEFNIIKANSGYEYREASGHKILVNDYNGNTTNDYSNVYKIIDLDSKKILNTVKIENDLDFNNVLTTNLNDNCATVSNSNNNGTLKSLMVWYYNINAQSLTFDDYYKAINTNSIQTETDEIIKQIKKEYNIYMEYSIKKDFFDYDITNDCLPIIFYLGVLNIKNDLAYFPAEFYNELLCNDISNPISSFDEFHIYLVGKINDDVAAYASNICCDETDNKTILYTVYSCKDYNRQTFFHEMMHQMEYRIWNYDKEFDTEWEKLNPNSFNYDFESTDAYFDNEEWQSYFVRDYGTKSILEDRADCFGALCDSGLDGNRYWEDNTELSKKMDLLSNTIIKSFPSLTNNAFWLE